MKTDAKTMAGVLRKVADNIENSLDKNDGVQAMYVNNEWEDRTTNDLCFVEGVKYRIKPETITLNGVEIPKPLSRNEIEKEHDGSSFLYFPCIDPEMYITRSTAYCLNMNAEKFLCYKTKEEAIEASKKLFGIE